MGEYAKYRGQDIKIGTCESMYYLRADQRHLIAGYRFDGSERFRFPFPDEDNLEPGNFEDYDRGARVPGWRIPADFEDHGIVQFTAPQGYNLCIPCPEGVHGSEPGLGPIDVDGVKVHRYGWNGGPVVKQQREIDGEFVTVVACGACGAAWRLPTKADAAPIAEAFLDEAERQEYRRDLDGWGYANSESHRAFLIEMASRILAGYAYKEAATMLGT